MSSLYNYPLTKTYFRKMVDLKQTFNFYDYFGFLAVGAIFALSLLIISFFLINFLFVNKKDEPTIFEKVGKISFDF